ncbi:MAG: Na/Pi symporter [Bacteroidota bacterium]
MKENDRHIAKESMPSFTTGASEGTSLGEEKMAQSFRPVQIGGLLAFMGIFILSIFIVTEGSRSLGTALADQLVHITANPFISLFIGILATALIQSSSTTTTLIVSLVAVSTLSPSEAIPLILGANIGTAVTSTLVALGYIGDKEEFEQAVASASLHDLFNIFTTLILFIVEVSTRALSDFAWKIASLLPRIDTSLEQSNYAISRAAQQAVQLFGDNSWLSLLLGLCLLFASLRGMTWLLKTGISSRLERNLNKYIFDRPLNSFLAGTGTTFVIQSSSVMTSLIVPLAASGKVRLSQLFPFIMGANLGTTSTALIAALLSPAVSAQAAIGVACVHVLFNLTGVLIFLPFRSLREIPIRIAAQLGKWSRLNRIYGVFYVVLVFFGLPFLLIVLSR